MNPNSGAEFRKTLQIWFGTIEYFVWCFSIKCFGRSPVLEVNGMINGFTPQKFRQSTGMQHRSHLLQQGTIQPLSYTIMLRRIMNGKVSHSTHICKVITKIITQIFFPTVGMKFLNVNPLLTK